jgi:hypothetical protein
MKTIKPTNRRNFLLAAGVGGVATAAVVMGQRVKPVGKIAGADEDAKPSGYHATDHIRKYYKTTKV